MLGVSVYGSDINVTYTRISIGVSSKKIIIIPETAAVTVTAIANGVHAAHFHLIIAITMQIQKINNYIRCVCIYLLTNEYNEEASNVTFFICFM